MKWTQHDIADAFYEHGIFDAREMDISHRLTFEDKKTILSTIKEHGRRALVNVTKGGEIFYDRDAGSVCGPDREFLDAVFLQGVAPDTASLMSYVGPSKIVLFHSKSHLDQKGLVVVDSYSPFKDRALFQKPLLDEVINGYRFCATMQRRNSLYVLSQHGRIERRHNDKLPAIARESWQGIWTATTDLWEGFGMEAKVEATRTMASSIGQIPIDGGDYLRYLLIIKRIEACKAPVPVRSNLYLMAQEIQGIAGHHFGMLRSAN
ncbi:hypothetical protein ACX3YD_22300 [Pseudomonas fluorescens group sp. PF-1]